MASLFSSSSPIPPWIAFWLSLLFITLTQADVQMVTVTASPTAPSPPSYTSIDDFKNAVMSVSNAYRKDHGAGHLIWNDSLADYALNWANGCIWEHSNGSYGENLAFGYPNATSAICAWGDERHEYNYKKPTGFTEETGHFTQLVWRSTLQVGCAAVDCGYDDPDLSDIKDENGRFRKAQGWYVVCEYAPAGNIVGKGFKSFKANVRPPRTGSSDDDDNGSGGAGAAGARGYVGGSMVLIVLVNAMFLLL